MMERMDEIVTVWSGAVRTARFQTLCPNCSAVIRPGETIGQVRRGEARPWVCLLCAQAASVGRYEAHAAEVKVGFAERTVTVREVR